MFLIVIWYLVGWWFQILMLLMVIVDVIDVCIVRQQLVRIRKIRFGWIKAIHRWWSFSWAINIGRLKTMWFFRIRKVFNGSNIGVSTVAGYWMTVWDETGRGQLWSGSREDTCSQNKDLNNWVGKHQPKSYLIFVYLFFLDVASLSQSLLFCPKCLFLLQAFFSRCPWSYFGGLMGNLDLPVETMGVSNFRPPWGLP